jgi:uncharacterized protein (TIGR00725 family)
MSPKTSPQTDWRKRPRVALIGGSRPDPAFLETAHKVGRLLAERGAVLVCGGLGGVMEAAARGAKEAGGTTIGILPGGDRADANSSIDVPIATGLGYTRNSIVALNADAIIAVDGEYGTLSEIAYGIICGRPSSDWGPGTQGRFARAEERQWLAAAASRTGSRKVFKLVVATRTDSLAASAGGPDGPGSAGGRPLPGDTEAGRG